VGGLRHLPRAEARDVPALPWCLQAERRLLISGDHLLGRVSPYYDFGHTADPAGEFLTSLDRVEALDARLCLAGHGRTFTDVQATSRPTARWWPSA
jgi:glyoxylase-like metal-dependent hydrolase (beta-lactamase superfamily II)